MSLLCPCKATSGRIASKSQTRSGPMGSTGETFGKAMLEKMGWKEGTGLGAKRDGLVEPISVKSRNENRGVGAERDRPFQNDWWAKGFEQAFGGAAKGAPAGNDVDLFAACGGRRCRPHGAAKLARIEKADRGKADVETPVPGSAALGRDGVASAGKGVLEGAIGTCSASDGKREKVERKERKLARRAKRARKAERQLRKGEKVDGIKGGVKKKRRREK